MPTEQRGVAVYLPNKLRPDLFKHVMLMDGQYIYSAVPAGVSDIMLELHSVLASYGCELVMCVAVTGACYLGARRQHDNYRVYCMCPHPVQQLNSTALANGLQHGDCRCGLAVKESLRWEDCAVAIPAYLRGLIIELENWSNRQDEY